MGVKKIPIETKKARGTNRSDRENKKQPRKVPMDGGVPNWLDDVASKKYVELKEVLQQMKILSKSDLAMLAKLCDSWSNFMEARKVIQKDGLTYTTTTAQGDIMIRPRPEFGIMDKERNNLIKYFTEFGMTPSSRQRVQMLEDDPKDPFAEI